MLRVEAKSVSDDDKKINTDAKTNVEKVAPTPGISSTDTSQPGNRKEEKAQKEENDELLPFEWMVKPCSFYKEEYSDCTSLKARFNQYFVQGEALECASWNEDFKNCTKWETDKDEEALQKLIESEKARVRTRLRNHYANDIWKNREKPPEDWNKELPLNIQEGYDSSFLKRKNDEINDLEDKDGGKGLLKSLDGSCVIM